MYDLETPALLLHLDVVERNLAHMADRARNLGVSCDPTPRRTSAWSSAAFS